MNASSSTVNLFPEKLQSGLSVSDLRALEISNPSRQPPNRYDSSVVNKNSKEGYYFFDVLKPPSLQNQQESLAARNSVKPPAINNPDKHDSQTQNQNAQLREEIQLLHEDYRVEVAKYEEEIRDLKRQFSLHAQNTDTKSADIEKKVLTIESRAKVAEAENLQLKSKLTEIKARNEQYEDTVRNMTRKMEKALRSNRLLLERGTELDEALTETQKRWLETKKEYENLSRWVVAHKESLSDYEAAMDVSNAFSNFPAGISKEFPQGSNVLSHHVKALIDSKKGKC